MYVCSSLACQNGLSSNLALVATSDCALHALDVAAGCPIATISSAHERPIEEMQFVPASPFMNTDAASVACNTVLTSSKGSCVRLWDLRAMKPVRQFGISRQGTSLQSHTKLLCAAAISGCGRLVACGAADPPEVHTYDTRMAGRIQSLRQVRIQDFLSL